MDSFTYEWEEKVACRKLPVLITGVVLPYHAFAAPAAIMLKQGCRMISAQLSCWAFYNLVTLADPYLAAVC